MKNNETLAKQIDRDFQDDNYFSSIFPAWLGQEEEACITDDAAAGELPREIQLFDKQLGDVKSGAYDEAVTAETAEEFFDECPGPDLDEEDWDFLDYDPGDCAKEFRAYFNPDDYYDEECAYNENEDEMALIYEDMYGYSDDCARGEDTGWFYED